MRDIDAGIREFQSRLGFSGRLDASSISSAVGRSSGFNPVLGFLVVSTGDRRAACCGCSQFQSRLGFSGRLDPARRRQRRSRRRFNPVLGFLVVSTWRLLADQRDVEFQSRLGFSGRLDLPVDFGRIAGVRQVSIPSWVFWSSRHALDALDASCEFQSRLGFSGRLDGHAIRDVQTGRPVSIPSWVFWSSRPSKRLARRTSTCFNPVLGFLVVSTAHRERDQNSGRLFQSRLGFSGRLDGVS